MTTATITIQINLNDNGYFKTLIAKDSEKAAEAVDAIVAFAVKKLKGVERASQVENV